MPHYVLEKKLSDGLIARSTYYFKSPQEGKAHFCNEILGRYEIDPISSKNFEEMGDFLSYYSPSEKCYIVRAYTTSATDLYKWLHSTDKDYLSTKRHIDILGDESLEEVYRICVKLHTAVTTKISNTSYDTAWMHWMCCAAQDKLSPKGRSFDCISHKESYLEEMPKIGCSSKEDVCDGGRFSGYSYFDADADEL